MVLDLTVTIPSIPGREHLLADALRSIAGQTVKPSETLVRVQPPPQGRLNPLHLASQRNALLRAVSTEWLAVLDDDDVYLPHHFEAVAPVLDDADVVYTFARVGVVANEDVTGWSSGRLVERLKVNNIISSNAAIRAETVRAIGGWSDDPTDFDIDALRFRETGAQWEDGDLWTRLAQAGARFVCVPKVTWDYRSGLAERCTYSWPQPASTAPRSSGDARSAA
jgi:hypothetical protein